MCYSRIRTYVAGMSRRPKPLVDVAHQAAQYENREKNCAAYIQITVAKFKSQSPLIPGTFPLLVYCQIS